MKTIRRQGEKMAIDDDSPGVMDIVVIVFSPLIATVMMVVWFLGLAVEWAWGKVVDHDR